jgi:hypothetical protein
MGARARASALRSVNRGRAIRSAPTLFYGPQRRACRRARQGCARRASLAKWALPVAAVGQPWGAPKTDGTERFGTLLGTRCSRRACTCSTSPPPQAPSSARPSKLPSHQTRRPPPPSKARIHARTLTHAPWTRRCAHTCARPIAAIGIRRPQPYRHTVRLLLLQACAGVRRARRGPPLGVRPPARELRAAGAVRGFSRSRAAWHLGGQVAGSAFGSAARKAHLPAVAACKWEWR